MKVFQQYTIALVLLLAQAAFAKEDSLTSNTLRGKNKEHKHQLSVFEEINAKPVVGLSHSEVQHRCALLKDLVFNNEPSLKSTKGATLLSSCQKLFMSAEDVKVDHKVKIPSKRSKEGRKDKQPIVPASAAKTE